MSSVKHLPSATLKPGKEIALRRRHPWIFSGALASLPTDIAGGILPVKDHNGTTLGWGYFNTQTTICGRMLSWDPTQQPANLIEANLTRAVELRSSLLPPDTTAYRLVNAEGDNLPGLVVDCYQDVLVMQVQTLGMEKLKPQIVAWLIDYWQPKGIYEKSIGTARRQEGLHDSVGVIYGEVGTAISVKEWGLDFTVSVREGQKTGLFLDQRTMRQRVRELAVDRRVLNCFAYAGGFSIYAYAGGAAQVMSVDSSPRAIAWAEQNFDLNGGQRDYWQTQVADVFAFLQQDVVLDYDLVILDPPAFAKKARDTVAACRGYRDLNRLAFSKLAPGALLLTCSCTQPVSEELFREQLFLAAVDAGRSVQILERLRHSPDHPVSLFHPEGNYLKGFLLSVN